MNRIKFFGFLFALSTSASLSLAQTDGPSAATVVANSNVVGDKADIKADMADIKTEIAKVRAQQKAAAATRQQMLAIRVALRAKLAVLHH